MKLVVVFNHRFDRNLPVLDAMYAGRFDPTYLVPFYPGDRTDVVPVFHSSHRFQGFFAEGFANYRRDDVTHYVFGADDLYLNPRLDAENFAEALGLGPRTGYIKSLSSLASAPLGWMHQQPAIHLFHSNTGVEYARELPDADQATALVQRHVDLTTQLGLHNVADAKPLATLRDPFVQRSLTYFARHPRRARLNYPLLFGYSDLLVVPADAIEQFVRLCGVFAAMGLFVEIAAPTALAMSCAEVKTEKDSPMKGVELWEPADQKALVDDHDGRSAVLQERFPEDQLYVHPMKLSQWKDVL